MTQISAFSFQQLSVAFELLVQIVFLHGDIKTTHDKIHMDIHNERIILIIIIDIDIIIYHNFIIFIKDPEVAPE